MKRLLELCDAVEAGAARVEDIAELVVLARKAAFASCRKGLQDKLGVTAETPCPHCKRPRLIPGQCDDCRPRTCYSCIGCNATICKAWLLDP